jgi:cathepsin L
LVTHTCTCVQVGSGAKGANVSAVAGITGYVKLPPNDNEALLEAVALNGPVAISVDASWGNYESGVFDSCSNKTVTIDHGVQVVGYGEENGMMYW